MLSALHLYACTSYQVPNRIYRSQPPVVPGRIATPSQNTLGQVRQ
jgi:hypothetical protein